MTKEWGWALFDICKSVRCARVHAVYSRFSIKPGNTIMHLVFKVISNGNVSVHRPRFLCFAKPVVGCWLQ